MADIFEATARKYRGSPAVVILFFLSIAMLVIGINHFIEDTYSSYYGLKNLESAYGLNVQIFNWTYWTMSLAPQVATMVFFYMYLSDTTRKDFLIMSLGAQIMDFFADSWYRSNGHLFQNFEVLGISAMLTFIYFSIGSEFFVTVGGGLVLKLAAPALQTLKVIADNIKRAKNMNYNIDQQGGRDKGGGDKGGEKGKGDFKKNNGHDQRKEDRRGNQNQMPRDQRIAMLRAQYHPEPSQKPAPNPEYKSPNSYHFPAHDEEGFTNFHRENGK